MNDEELAAEMLALLPEDGKSRGNVTLRGEWRDRVQDGSKTTDDDYWRIRQRLLDAGEVELGRGRGGSVRRSAAEDAIEISSALGIPIAADDASAEPVRKRESDLYEPVRRTIQEYWAKSELALPAASFVSCVSAFQGKASTGGKWTRPDITLVSARRFDYLGPMVEVVTFEIKPFDSLAVDAVFETAAHTARAHRCFLLAEVPPDEEQRYLDSDDFSRIESECLRFGVGLATLADAEDGETWTVHVRPRTHSPDPLTVESWLGQCFSRDPALKAQLIDLVGSVFGNGGSR